MGVPGSDLLAEALQIIETDTIQILKQNVRTLNAAGIYVTTYGEPVDFEASVQAVDRNTYNQLGLDMNKRYIQIYVSDDVNDLTRDTTGDKVHFNGREYSITSALDWFAIDGWVGLLCVDVGPVGVAP
ncbi:hypothetical protein D3C81_678170 [compost metagenome]